MDEENKNNETEQKKGLTLKKTAIGAGSANKADIQKTIMLKRTVTREKLKSGDTSSASGGAKPNFGRTLKLKLKTISESDRNAESKVEPKTEQKSVAPSLGRTLKLGSAKSTKKSETVVSDSTSKQTNLSSKGNDIDFDKTVKLKMGSSSANVTANGKKEDDLSSADAEKTIKLHLPSSKKNGLPIINPDKTVKLKLPVTEKGKEGVSKQTETVEEKKEVKTPLKVGSAVNKESEVKTEKEINEAASVDVDKKKTLGDLGKTLKMKLGSKSSSSGNSLKGTASSGLGLKNTLKLKSSLGNKSSQNASDITEKTMNLKRTQTTSDSIASDDKERTIKLKIPVTKNNLNESNILNKTLKLKKSLPGLSNSSSNNKPANDISVTKTVTNLDENVIKLKSVSKKDGTLDPLATQTIKIKPVATSPTKTVKIPAVTSESQISDTVNITDSAKVSNTIVMPMPDVSGKQKSSQNDEIIALEKNIEETVDLPSIDSQATQEELNAQTQMFEGLSLNEEPTAKKETEKEQPKKTGVPDLGDLKGVLDDLKNAKKEKVQKTVEKKTAAKNTGKNIDITQNKKASVVAIAVASATLLALVGVLYFALTSYLTIL
jgi:hypothetical protein